MCQQNTTIITGISGNFNQVIFFLSYHRDIMPRLILTTFIMITTNTVIINSDNQPNLSSQSSSLLSPSSSLLLIPSITLTALCGTIVFLLSHRVSVFFCFFNHNYILHWSKGVNPFSHCLWLFFIALILQPPFFSYLQMWKSVLPTFCQSAFHLHRCTSSLKHVSLFVSLSFSCRVSFLCLLGVPISTHLLPISFSFNLPPILMSGTYVALPLSLCHKLWDCCV